LYLIKKLFDKEKAASFVFFSESFIKMFHGNLARFQIILLSYFRLLYFRPFSPSNIFRIFLDDVTSLRQFYRMIYEPSLYRVYFLSESEIAFRSSVVHKLNEKS